MSIIEFKFEKPTINPDEIPGRKDLIEFFRQNGIEKYLEIFPKTVNFAFFKTMSEDDFTEYGIKEENDMKILIDAVDKAVAEEEQEEEHKQERFQPSPSTPTHHRNVQLLDPERRKSSFFFRSSSFEPFSPIRDEPVSNLVRMRNNSSLGNSDPSLSTSTGDLAKKLSTCGISPRRPRSLLPHSPSPPRALSPVASEYGTKDTKTHTSPNSTHAPIPFQCASTRSFQSGRRWSVASSGYRTDTPCSSGFSSRTSSQEKLNQLQFYDESVFSRQYSHDSTYSDVDDDWIGRRSRSPRSFRGRSRSLSPSRSDNEVSILNRLYTERFPKAKAQMEEKLKEFLEEYSHESLESKISDAAISFVSHQILEIARNVLKFSLDPEVNITSAFFYGISDTLDKLLFEVREKTTTKDIENIKGMTSQLLMMLSRPARLLECLEFDPSMFYTQLEVEELMLNQQRIGINDMGDYIKNKLGLETPFCSENKDTPEAFADGVDGRESNEKQVGKDKQDGVITSTPTRKTSILIEPKEEDFSYVKLISNGAYGSVYLVRHNTSKERFAMKKMSKHHLMHKNQVEQVFTERDIMTFAQNPFVVTLVCTFETKKYLCMVMEYVEGGDCASLLKNIGVLTLDLASRYFAETVLAVEYIHEYGIIHRDLKPDNLLITAEGHIKLADFGLSKMGLMNLTTNICEQTMAQFNDIQVFGTPDYIAPEVILRKGYGKPVDYWSLGIILYEFLVGLTPFFAESVSLVFELILAGEIEWPDGDEALPPEAVDLIKSLLIQDPLDRLGTGGSYEVKEHPFFSTVSWNTLLREKAEFVPVLDDEEDTSYFDTREDRYNHLQSDEEYEQDDDDIEIGNFSTCSPRFSKMLSSAEIKDYSSSLKDLQEASKEASSSESLVECPKCDTLDDDVKERQKSETKSVGETSTSDDLLTKVEVTLHSPLERTDSGADSGTFTCSSLDGSFGSNSSLLKQAINEVKKRPEEYDTDASTSSCDLSPRRFTSTASFALQRVPSPKQPSPLVIDTSREEDSTLKVASSTPSLDTNVVQPRAVSRSFGSSNHPIRLHRTKSTPPNIDLTRVNTPVPKLELSASEDELTLMFRRPSRRRNNHSRSLRRRDSDKTPPESPNERKDFRRVSSPISLRPPIIITSKTRDFGFSLKAIRVYLGQSSKYTMQHLVEKVSRNGAAFEAGLKERDLITHVNSEPVQGLQHVDVVRLISQSDTVRLSVIDLSSTSIRTGSKRKTLGSRVLSRKLRSRSRNSSTEDSGRVSSGSKKSAIYKKLRKTSLRRSSSLKRASSKSGSIIPGINYDKGRLLDESTGSLSSSPSSPSSQVSRPAFLHGIIPKRLHNLHSPRRRSISVIPVSPLARTPSSGTIRSPSPYASKSGSVLLSPTNSNGSRNKTPNSPLLRRALSPERVTNLEFKAKVPDKKLIRSQSMRESKRKKNRNER